VGKQLSPYFKAFIVAFSFTLGLGFGVYVINIILPSRTLSTIVIFGTVFIGIFSMSLAYAKPVSTAQNSKKANTAIKKPVIILILNMCMFLIISIAFIYITACRVVGIKVIAMIGILLIIYVVYFLRYFIVMYYKIAIHNAGHH
jgi:small-conductance mechanosensitive channel